MSNMTGAWRDWATTKGWVTCISPMHKGSVVHPNTGILSPKADTSFNLNDTVLYSVEKAAALLS